MALVLAVSGPYLVNQLGTAFNGGAAAMQRSFPRHSAVPAGCPGGPDGPPVPGSCTPANASLVAVVEPQAGFGPLYQAISAARSTVDLTIYELVDPTAETDLAADAGRGVTVRVILDHNLERAHNTTAYRYLTAHGVHVVWAAPRYAATHQKTLTVDHTTSIVMTANLTAADYPTTRDFLVTDTDPADVASIESTFDADFTGTTLTPATGAGLVWSPTNSQNSILAMIDGATRTLAVENEEMGLPAVTNALAAAARRGVNVTVTMTASPHWARPFAQLAAAGVHVATYPNTSTALYIHAKVIVADAGTAAARAFVGSENFSTASLTRNRELGITTPTPAVVDAVSATLTADYHGAQAN
jgi:phosphatidylserine/phosphatidylglycerophosphate/cardiolipin synthase-like enzyme